MNKTEACKLLGIPGDSAHAASSIGTDLSMESVLVAWGSVQAVLLMGLDCKRSINNA